MKRFALVLTLLPLVAFGDIILKDESTRVGPVTTLNCVGSDVTCTRSGATAVLTISVDGGAPDAPTDADYLVKTSNASLSAERVVTNTTTVTWDWSTAGQAKASVVKLPADGTNCTTGQYARGVDAFGNAQNCSTDLGIGTLLLLTSDVSTTSSSYSDVTGLSWDPHGGARVPFQCYLIYTSEDTATGLMFAINAPAGATPDYRLEIQTAGNPGTGSMSTTTQPWTHGTTLDEATKATTGVAAINTPYYATMIGVLKMGETSGPAAIRFLSETDGKVITVKAGSWCVYY